MLRCVLLWLQRLVISGVLLICRPFWSPLPKGGEDAGRLWELLHFGPVYPDAAPAVDDEGALSSPPLSSSVAAYSCSARIWRGVDPLLAMRKKRLTLVLDLDLTLACTVPAASYYRGATRGHAERWRAPDGSFDVCRGDGCGEPTTYLVWRRPHLDLFLREAARWFRVVVFTAGRREYADPLCDFLDPHCVVRRRLYRGSCKTYQHLGCDGAAKILAGGIAPCSPSSASPSATTFFVKDLSIVSDDLSKVLLLDDSPGRASGAAAGAAVACLCSPECADPPHHTIIPQWRTRSTRTTPCRLLPTHRHTTQRRPMKTKSC